MSRVVSQLRRFSALAISGCVALALSVAAHAQTFSITNVGNSANKASYPSMVVDVNGNLNLVWVDSVNGIMFARSSTTTAGTTTLGTAVPVTGSTGQALPAFQPQIAVDPNDARVIAITWAALDPTSPAGGPAMYDVYASWSNTSGQLFTTAPPISTSVSPAGLPLADSPRLAFDTGGRANIVWGQTAAWIVQTQDGSFPNLPVNLANITPPTAISTFGPRVAVDGHGEVVVAWTDIANASANGSYCLLNPLPPEPTPITNTVGGNFWVNETLQVNGAYSFNASNTRNLANTDWLTGGGAQYQVGFFGCSYDNLNLFTDGEGLIHLLWSDDPHEDVLTSKPVNGDDPITYFSFPINLASLPAAWPQVAVGAKGSFYVVWSGGPTGGGSGPGQSNSQGIFFSRSDDGGNNFTPSINIAPPSAVAPAYPQVAVDSTGNNVYVVWEQVDQSQPLSTKDTFNVFFAHSTDKGVTFPTVSQVSTNSSALCIPATPVQTTPNSTICGSVQIGLDPSANPDMAWVNQVSGAAVADIDFATTNLAPPPSDFSISSTQMSQTAQPGQTANFTVNATGTGGFSGSIALACTNFFVTEEASGQQPTTSLIPTLTCSAPTLSVPGSSTVSVVVPADILSNAVFAQLSFEIAGTSTAGTTHKITVSVNVGNGPASITPASASLSSANPSQNFAVNVNPADFTGSLTLSCLDADTGGPLPAWLGCSFTPNPLNTAQSFTTQLTLTEVSTPTSSSLISPPLPFAVPGFGSGFRIASSWTMAFAALCMMLMMFTLGRRQRLSAAVVLRGFLVMTLTIVLATALVSCGGSTSTPSTTTTSTGGTGSTGGSGGSGSGGSGGSGSSGGSSGGTGGGSGTGTGGGTVTPVQIHVSVLAQSSANTVVTLGTVTITAQ